MAINKRHPIWVIFLLGLFVCLLILILRDNNLSFPDLGYPDKNPGQTSQVYKPDSNTTLKTDSNTTPKTDSNTNIKTPAYIIQKTSLTEEERNIVKNAILSSEFVSALPNDGIISLQFFNFENGQRVWLDKFLIGKNSILTSGTPDIFITLHYKYIEQLTENNLCDTIQTSNANGDLGAWSDLSDARLALKYSSVIKYRDCFGI
jgi:hypothetical protein